MSIPLVQDQELKDALQAYRAARDVVRQLVQSRMDDAYDLGQDSAYHKGWAKRAIDELNEDTPVPMDPA